MEEVSDPPGIVEYKGEIDIKQLFIILGNGFSIDVMKRINRDDDIDLVNLFRKGAEVPWPGTAYNGFLSYKYCEALWTLGARTTMSKEQSIKLIEDIITCINVFNYSRLNNLQKTSPNRQRETGNNIFLKAYGELTTYLRYLFIYYNNKIDDNELHTEIPFIKYIKYSLKAYDKIIIINYNYDIWLERLLLIHNIPFNIAGFETNGTQIQILKPHGSISFSFKVKITGQFSTRELEFDNITQDAGQFDIKYDFADDFPIVNAIIPPAGDPNRTNFNWIKNIRELINNKIESAANDDALMIFGLSYWHVDRMEIDEILTRIDPNVNVYLVNPNPPTSLDAVLTSLFNNYIHLNKSDLLEASI